MKSIVISAKYNRDTDQFIHGKSYLLSVSSSLDGGVAVNDLKEKDDQYI